MKWAVLAVRVLVGLSFTFIGGSYFLMPPEEPTGLPDNAVKFVGSMVATNYFDVVKALELIGGLLLLSGRLTPLGLVILVPVTVNIALWDIFMMKLGAPPGGLILLAMEAFVMWGYWPYFAAFFKPTAKHV